MPKSKKQFLSQTETDWEMLSLAHNADAETSRGAWSSIEQKYSQAIRNCLRRLVKEEDTVEELCQEFWIRMVAGQLSDANPERGRFRNLLKTILIHLVADHFRKLQRQQKLMKKAIGRTLLLEQVETDYTAEWRSAIIQTVREKLRTKDKAVTRVSDLVLNIEIEHPEKTSVEKAKLLSQKTKRNITDSNYRQLLSRARTRFSNLLIEEVKGSLSNPTKDAINEELAELGLLRFCDPQSGNNH